MSMYYYKPWTPPKNDTNDENDEDDENGEDWLLSRITLDKKCVLSILHKILPNGRWQTIACQTTRQRCTKCYTQKAISLRLAPPKLFAYPRRLLVISVKKGLGSFPVFIGLVPAFFAARLAALAALTDSPFCFSIVSLSAYLTRRRLFALSRL